MDDRQPLDQQAKGLLLSPVLALGMEEGNWQQGPPLSLLVKRPSLRYPR